MFKSGLELLLGQSLTDGQMDQFETYYHFLVEYNQITNLTRITDKHEVYYKHFYDSLTLTNVCDFSAVLTICDMGSGAGFPSIPLKIIYPHLHVTIIDSLGKRITFLTKLIQKLQLDNVELIHDRIETFALSHQKSFDVVTARALGHLSLICEMGIPMLKENGYFIAPKGSNYQSEVDDAKKAISTLGGSIDKMIVFQLPFDYGQRANILIQKKKHIQGYPRSFALMNKKTL